MDLSFTDRQLVPDQFIGKLHPRYSPPESHLPFFGDSMLGLATIGDAQRGEARDRLKALDRAHVKLAREDFNCFMEYCFMDVSTGRPFAQQWYHREWAELMSVNQRCLIIGPRNHGKTSQIVGRTIWELGRNPNLRIKIVCAADSRAKERLFEVHQHIMYNERVRAVFPNLIPDPNGQWTKHAIVVKRNALHRDSSIEALGITSTATGGRADLLIADDVVDRRNALSFPALREQIKQAWKSDWTNLLEPDSRVWYICTLWHKDDLSHQLIENAAYEKAIYAVPDDFGSLWQEKWPSELLYHRFMEIGSVEFNRGFRNQAVDESTRLVQDSWFKFSNLERDEEFIERFEHLVFFSSYDTARAVHQGADFSACCIGAVDAEKGKVYIIDAWHGRLTVKQQAQEVWKAFLRYQPYRIFIEKVGQAVLDEWVLNEHPELIGYIEVTVPKVNKAQRLMGVTPLMEAGRVIMSDHLNPDSDKWDPSRDSLVHELQDFPFAKHDDQVDAFSQLLDGVRRYVLDAWSIGIDNDQSRGVEREQQYLY